MLRRGLIVVFVLGLLTGCGAVRPQAALPPTQAPAIGWPIFHWPFGPRATPMPNGEPSVVVFPTPTASTGPEAASTQGMAPLAVVGWNVGLGDADDKVIARTIAGFQGIDLWGLAEVERPSDAEFLARAAAEGENAGFGYVLGATGGAQQLLALYDKNRFDLVESSEYAPVNVTGTVRAPLILHLRDKASGQEFLFMVNHLYRSDDAQRKHQAQLLNAWAKRQALPVIAVGDYNMDWSVSKGEARHDPAYDAMTANGVWQWVRPARLVTTQCSGWPCAYNSVLDFVFTAGAAQGWAARSAIAVIPGDFPDNTKKSDHRPVIAQFAPGGQGALAGAPAVMLPPVGYNGQATGAGDAGQAQATPNATPTVPPLSTIATPVPAGSQSWPAYACKKDPSPPPDKACPIKGNVSNSARIYHVPGQQDYCNIRIDVSKGERWFCSTQEAEAAGWRAARR